MGIFIFFASLTNASFAEQPVTLGEVLQNIKKEITIAQAQEVGKRPKILIDKIDLELSIATVNAGEAGLKIIVPGIEFNAGGGGSTQSVQKFYLTMVPENKEISSEDGNFGLVRAIQAVKEAIREGQKKGPILTLDNAVYETEFVLKYGGNGGVSFLVFEVGSIEREKVFSNKLKVYMSGIK